VSSNKYSLEIAINKKWLDNQKDSEEIKYEITNICLLQGNIHNGAIGESKPSYST
jgi:hypothetical protein